MSESSQFKRNRLRKAREALRLVTPLFRRHRWRILTGLLALLSVDLLQLMIPRVIKSAIDSLQFATATQESLFLQGGLIVLFALGIALFELVSGDSGALGGPPKRRSKRSDVIVRP